MRKSIVVVLSATLALGPAPGDGLYWLAVRATDRVGLTAVGYSPALVRVAGN